MRYVIAKHNKNVRDTTFQIYVTDCLYGLVSAFGGGESIDRYYNLIYDKQSIMTAEQAEKSVMDEFIRLGGEK